MIVGELADLPASAEQLDGAIADTLAAMHNASGPLLVELGVRIAILIEHRDRIRDCAREDLREHISRVYEVARSLRAAASSTELMQRVCLGLAEMCGADRVVLCRLEQDRVTPAGIHDGTATASLPASFDIAPGSAEARALESRAPVCGSDPPATLRALFSGRYLMTVITIEARPVALVYIDGEIDVALHDSVTMVVEVLGACFARLGLATRRNKQLSLLRTSTRSWADDIEAPSRAALPEGESGAGPRPVEPLTAREVDVLRLLLTGAGNSVIAAELVITVDTVKSHVKRILRKLGSANRGELIAKYDGADLVGLRVHRL